MHASYIYDKKKKCAMKTLKELKNRLEKLNLGRLLNSEKSKKNEPRTLITASTFDDEDLFMFI